MKRKTGKDYKKEYREILLSKEVIESRIIQRAKLLISNYEIINIDVFKGITAKVALDIMMNKKEEISDKDIYSLIDIISIIEKYIQDKDKYIQKTIFD